MDQMEQMVQTNQMDQMNQMEQIEQMEQMEQLEQMCGFRMTFDSLDAFLNLIPQTKRSKIAEDESILSIFRGSTLAIFDVKTMLELDQMTQN